MADGNSAQLHGINSRGEAIDNYGNVMSWVDPNDVMGLLAQAIMYGDNYYGTASDIRAYFNNQGMSDDEINSRLSPDVKQQLGSQLSFKQSQSDAYNPESVNKGVSFLQEQGIPNQEINNDVSKIAQSYQDANASVRAIQQAGLDQSARDLRFILATGALVGGTAGLGLLGEAPIASELGALTSDAAIQSGLSAGTVAGAGEGVVVTPIPEPPLATPFEPPAPYEPPVPYEPPPTPYEPPVPYEPPPAPYEPPVSYEPPPAPYEPPVSYEPPPTFDASPNLPVSDVPPELDPTSSLVEQAAYYEPPPAPYEPPPTFDASPDVPVSDVPPELDPTSSLVEQAASAQTPEQVALDKLVEQQSALYPAIGNNIIGLPQVGEAALSGAGKGALTTVAVNALTGRPITAADIAKGAIIGSISGGTGSLIGQAADSSLLGNLAGTAAGVGTNLALSPGAKTTLSSAAPAVVGALTSYGSGTGSSSSDSGSNVTDVMNSGSTTSGKIPTPISGQSITGAPVYNTNAQILQQLKQLDPKLLSMIAPHLSSSFQNTGLIQSGLSSLNPPSQATGGQQQNNPYSSLMQTMLAEKSGSNPTNSLLSSGVNMLSGSSPIGYKDGGDVHKPEFITGATGHYVKGRGDGQSDDIPAMLADGEYVFDADTVAALGNGSSDAGAKLLDHFRESLREHKRSAPTDKIPPKASPLAYMKEALRRHTKG
jgi:hypothetical protein